MAHDQRADHAAGASYVHHPKLTFREVFLIQQDLNIDRDHKRQQYTKLKIHVKTKHPWAGLEGRVRFSLWVCVGAFEHVQQRPDSEIKLQALIIKS